MILFLYTYSINRARTSGAFYEELAKRVGDGRQLQLLDINRRSHADIIRHIDNAGVIVLDNSILLAMGKKSILPRNFYVQKAKSPEFYLDIWGIVNRSDKPLFLFHASSDLHAENFGLQRDLFLELIKRCTGILWPYHQCPFKKWEQEKYPLDILNQFNLNKEKVIGIWEEIRSTIPISIDLPHCIAASELQSKTRKKVWDIIIPGGANYLTRNIAREKATKAGLFVAPFETNARWLVNAPYYLYNKLLRKKHSTPIYQRKSFRLYRYMIAMSSVSFACGSELRYFVRKFIEIPAFRSAMIAYPTLNFRDYGFEDGVHYLNSYPEEVAEKADFLLNNKESANKMINKAWHLVAEKHTASRRVDQVLACLQLFTQGKLKGAGFDKGDFLIE